MFKLIIYEKKVLILNWGFLEDCYTYEVEIFRLYYSHNPLSNDISLVKLVENFINPTCLRSVELHEIVIEYV